MIASLIWDQMETVDLRFVEEAINSRPDILSLRMNYAYEPACDSQLLHRAAQCGRSDSVLLLIERGSDPNTQKRPEGMTPLHFAAISEKPNPEVVRTLVAHGADVHALARINQAEETPLHLAIRVEQEDTAIALVECGASIYFNKGQEAPLSWARAAKFHRLIAAIPRTTLPFSTLQISITRTHSPQAMPTDVSVQAHYCGGFSRYGFEVMEGTTISLGVINNVGSGVTHKLATLIPVKYAADHLPYLILLTLKATYDKLRCDTVRLIVNDLLPDCEVHYELGDFKCDFGERSIEYRVTVLPK